MRKFIIAGNWKMNMTGAEAINLATALKDKVKSINNVDMVICPPFTALVPVNEVVQNSQLQLGAQNMHWEEAGAFTGEVTASMLINAGCRYVILGHSERREYFAETNQIINQKLRKALSTELNPILCVGEILEERKAGITEEILFDQLTECLAGIALNDISRIIIAYEPVWAIGTGVTATPEQAQSTQAYIRQFLSRKYGKEVANQIRIQYGGSMKPDNAEELLKQPDIDGGLIGGASLKADSFAGIIQIAERLSV